MADAITADRKRPVLTAAGESLTIKDLGWTQEQAAEIRARLASFAEDWDDPIMDVYDRS